MPELVHSAHTHIYLRIEHIRVLERQNSSYGREVGERDKLVIRINAPGALDVTYINIPLSLFCARVTYV